MVQPHLILQGVARLIKDSIDNRATVQSQGIGRIAIGGNAY